MGKSDSSLLPFPESGCGSIPFRWVSFRNGNMADATTCRMVLLGVCDSPCPEPSLSPFENKVGGYPVRDAIFDWVVIVDSGLVRGALRGELERGGVYN